MINLFGQIEFLRVKSISFFLFFNIRLKGNDLAEAHVLLEYTYELLISFLFVS